MAINGTASAKADVLRVYDAGSVGEAEFDRLTFGRCPVRFDGAKRRVPSSSSTNCVTDPTLSVSWISEAAVVQDQPLPVYTRCYDRVVFLRQEFLQDNDLHFVMG
jgi:hypothetical protein